MQKVLISVATGLLLGCAGTVAYTQTPPSQVPPQQQAPQQQELAPTPKINLTLEQRHTIRELIKDVKADATSANVQATVGDTIPQGVTAKPMPAEIGQKVPQVKAHRFFLTAQQIVIVDPKDNKVSELIKIDAD